jgi:hypothetical protein
VTSIVYTYDKKLLLGGSVDKNTTPPWEQAEIIKIDTAGNLIWRKEFGWQNYLNQFFDITELANLNILAVGSTDSNVWHTQGGLIVMMDSAGNVLWYKNMPPDSTFSYLGFCMETNDKGLLVSGTANDPAFVVPNNQQAWVVKLDSLGCDSTGCPFFVSGLGVAAVVAKEGLLIYPNPAEKELKIKDFKLAIKSVEVIDMIGNIMLNVEFPISNVERKINVSSLISGIYFIKVTTDMGSVVKKFIKE